jgi:hypothetical protein
MDVAARARRFRARSSLALALGALLLPTFAVAQGAPRLVIEPATIDFGAIERGSTVEYTFTLANRGSGELRIDHVKGSCGCTVAVASASEVPAGGEGRVVTRLDTAGMAGRVTKVVNVYTNDPTVPVAGLTLTGEVLTDIVVAPSPLYLGRVRRGERTRREVILRPGRPGVAETVTRVDHTGGVVQTTLEPLADGPGQKLVVELRRDVPLGRFNEQLTLRTTSAREPTLTLTVFGSVEGDVVVLPPQVTFGVTRADAALERDLFIRNRGYKPLTVTRVVVPPDIATYQLQTVADGQEYRVTLRLRDGLSDGKLQGDVEIFTNHPDEPRLVVPLSAVVRNARHG